MKVKTSPYCGRISKENPSRKHNTPRYLFPAGEEEFVRINAIDDGTPKERDPVKNDGRLIKVLKEQLLENIKYDRKYNEREEAPSNNKAGGPV